MDEEAEDLAHKLDDPLQDEHVCYYWDEVADRLERMVAFKKKHFIPVPQAA
jgi:hypothetical protein